MFPTRKESVIHILNNLIETSLVTVDNDNGTYKLQNFFTQYVHMKMKENKSNKIKYNRILATYFCDILI